MNSPFIFDPFGSAFLDSNRSPRDVRDVPPTASAGGGAARCAAAFCVGIAVFAIIASQHEANTARSVVVADLLR